MIGFYLLIVISKFTIHSPSSRSSRSPSCASRKSRYGDSSMITSSRSSTFNVPFIEVIRIESHPLLNIQSVLTNGCGFINKVINSSSREVLLNACASDGLLSSGNKVNDKSCGKSSKRRGIKTKLSKRYGNQAKEKRDHFSCSI